MKLTNGKIRPGKILKIEDEYGVVKACVPGLFSDQDDPQLLPPVYPFFTGNSNTFTKVNVDDEVWVLFFDDNPYELFYFRKDNIKDGLANVIKEEYDKIEVIASVEAGIGGYAQLYYTDGTGWIINNDKSYITINKNGEIVMDYNGSSHRQIGIDDSGISLGTVGGSAEPAVLGDKMEDTLLNIYSCLMAVKEAAKLTPYTVPIAGALEATLSKYKNSIQKIKSQHVTLD